MFNARRFALVFVAVSLSACSDEEPNRGYAQRPYRYGYYHPGDGYYRTPKEEGWESSQGNGRNPAQPEESEPESPSDNDNSGGSPEYSESQPGGSPAPIPSELPTPRSLGNGRVESPYAPGKQVDVEGFPPGSTVRDPYTGKEFIVPVPEKNQ